MIDGEVRVYDVAAPLGCTGGGRGMGGPLWTCQLITHDPSPRELGTEGRRQYRRWCETVGLDPTLGAAQHERDLYFGQFVFVYLREERNNNISAVLRNVH